LLYFFPAQNGGEELSLRSAGNTLVVYYCIIIVFISVGLWVLTLIFISSNIQRLWKRSRLGKTISEKKALSNICWGFVLFGFYLAVTLLLLLVALVKPASFLIESF